MLRRVSVFERPWLWLLSLLVISALLVLVVVLVASGQIDDPYGAAVRGYTLTGYLLGSLVVVLGTLTFAYSLRKRSLQEALPGAGSMMTWLWAHVTLGLLSLVAAFLHAGLGAISYSFSSGKLLLWVFVVLNLSGIVWRVFYRFVPPRATRKIGNFSREGMVSRATELTTEIEKVAAGKSDQFRELKDWVVSGERSEQEVAHAALALSAEEQALMQRVHRLDGSRRRAFGRMKLQGRFTRSLQRWRIIHVPLALAIPLLLVVHIIGATRMPTRMMPMGSAPNDVLSGFVRSRECKDCHKRIYDQWKRSMHAHSMTSPVMIAQANRVAREVLDDADAPDPKLVCVNCHGPVGVLLTQQEQATLPLERSGYDPKLLNEGISCTVCHQFTGNDPTPSAAGLSSFQKQYDPLGDTYYGPYDDPVGNAFHRSAKGEIFDNPNKLCVHCHNVHLDLNGDGKVEKGVDLVLQETDSEYDSYRAEGGLGTCLGCHMPLDSGTKDAADSAELIFEQDSRAPKRKVHDHSFVGVDHPIDISPKKDKQKKKRERLLRNAAKLEISASRSGLEVSITSTGVGHNLPTGFAFVRQMWLEVKATDGSGRVVLSSGVLKKGSHDLCDAATLDVDPPAMDKFVRGCGGGSDPNLVNLQLKLVDKIAIKRDANDNKLKNDDDEFIVVAAEGAKEVPFQFVTGGAVARVRPVDKQALVPIEPNETRTFKYRLPVGARSVSVRLLFRSMGPYFLRALGDDQPKKEPQVAGFVKNLQIIEMASKKLSL